MNTPVGGTPPPPPPADTQAPTAPAGLTASGQTQTQITLNWTASSDNVGVTGYSRYQNGTLISSGTGTSFSFTGLTCGTSYTLAVDAYDAAGNRSTRPSISAVDPGLRRRHRAGRRLLLRRRHRHEPHRQLRQRQHRLDLRRDVDERR